MFAFRSLFLALLTLLPLAAAAQPGATGTLTGTVRDQTGATVVGAGVTLTDADGRKNTTTPDSRGAFRFDSLAIGTYTLTVVAEGFATFERPVRVLPPRGAAVDVVLRVALSVSLDVVPAAPEPVRRRGQATTILTGKDLAALPDNYLPTLIEMAGGTRPGDVGVSVNGAANYRRLPPKEAIEMIRIDANPFSAEFSERSKKRVEITTKPGSDGLHGGVNLLLRGTALNARNALAETNPPMRYVDPDGFVSGPIKKDRADFEVYVSQSRHDENAVISATTLDPASYTIEPFRATVATPARTTLAVLKSNAKLFGQLFNVTLGATQSTQRDQGLGGGLELQERAHDVTTHDQGVEIGWTTIGPRAVNVVRAHVSHTVSTADPRLTSPGIVVLDAFSGGGSDTNSRDSSLNADASDVLIVRHGSHTMQTGVQFDFTHQDNVDRSGFNGAFLFGSGIERDAAGAAVLNELGQTIAVSPIENYRRTVLGVPGYGPSQFSIVTGAPRAGISQRWLGWFALDNWSISKQLWLAYGVRGEAQEHVSRRLNLAPRLSLSWQIDAKGLNAIAVYSGVFYTRVDPGVRFDALRLNGTLQQELVVQDPSFFPAIPALSTAALPTAATPAQSVMHTISPEVRMPYQTLGQFSYERKLPHGILGTVGFNIEEGRHLLRSRNLAASASAPVLQVESTGRSSLRELTLGMWGAFNKRASLWAGYTLGKKDSDTDNAYTMPANSLDLAAEYGTAADDRRHRFEAGAKINGPWSISINPYMVIMSGAPFNITTGSDGNDDTLFADRPAFANAGDPGAISTRYGWLTPNVRPGDRIIPRNLGRERRQIVVNLSVSKPLVGRIGASVNCQNLFNNKTLLGSNGVLTSGQFGQPKRALDGRSASVSLSFGF